MADDAWQRYARLLIDGLAPERGQALHPAPLRFDQVLPALQRRTA